MNAKPQRTAAQDAPSDRKPDIIDELSLLLNQIDAQSRLIAGEGFNAFECFPADMKSSYLHGLAQGASRAKELCSRL